MKAASTVPADDHSTSPIHMARTLLFYIWLAGFTIAESLVVGFVCAAHQQAGVDCATHGLHSCAGMGTIVWYAWAATFVGENGWEGKERERDGGGQFLTRLATEARIDLRWHRLSVWKLDSICHVLED